MSNMSYCRFQNTYGDLTACADHIRDKLGEDEARARKRLVMLCKDILEEAGLQIDGDVEEAIADLEANPEEERDDED